MYDSQGSARIEDGPKRVSVMLLGQIKKKCVLWNGSENFRLSRYTYILLFFSGEKKINAFLKGNSPFKPHKIMFFPENL